MIQFLLLFHPWDLISPSLLRPSFKKKIVSKLLVRKKKLKKRNLICKETRQTYFFNLALFKFIHFFSHFLMDFLYKYEIPQ